MITLYDQYQCNNQRNGGLKNILAFDSRHYIYTYSTVPLYVTKKGIILYIYDQKSNYYLRSA
jgi:hypothetical protein